MTAIEHIVASQLPRVDALIEDVVTRSVDASPDERRIFLERIRFNLEQWTEAPERSLHLGLIRNGALAGVVMVKDFWNLCHLFVDRSHQGQGIGRVLVRAALGGCASKSPRPYVQLNSTRNAVGFYERLGFVRVADAPARYAGMQFRFDLDAGRLPARDAKQPSLP